MDFIILLIDPSVPLLHKVYIGDTIDNSSGLYTTRGSDPSPSMAKRRDKRRTSSQGCKKKALGFRVRMVVPAKPRVKIPMFNQQ